MSQISNEEIAALNDFIRRRMMQLPLRFMGNAMSQGMQVVLPGMMNWMVSEMSRAFSDTALMEETRKKQEEANAEAQRVRTERLQTFEQRTLAFEALLERVQRR